MDPDALDCFRREIVRTLRAIAQGKHHYGIIVCRQFGIGWVIHKLCALLSTHSSDDLRDRIIWLSE